MEAKGMVNQLVATKAKKDLISTTSAHNFIWNLINVTLMKEVALALGLAKSGPCPTGDPTEYVLTGK